MTSRARNSKAPITIAAALAVGWALILPLRADAQNYEHKMLMNKATVAMLTNNWSKASGSALRTLPATFGSEQKWTFAMSVTAGSNYGNPQRITSDFSFLTMDIFFQLPFDYMPVVQNPQTLQDNDHPWKFQRWDVVRISNSDGLFNYQLRNRGSSRCLADIGAYPAGGAVVQLPCDGRDVRQLWAIFNNSTGRWETGAYLQIY